MDARSGRWLLARWRTGARDASLTSSWPWMARIPAAVRLWEAAVVEVHASQTELRLSGLHVLSRHVLL